MANLLTDGLTNKQTDLLLTELLGY